MQRMASSRSAGRWAANSAKLVMGAAWKSSVLAGVVVMSSLFVVDSWRQPAGQSGGRQEPVLRVADTRSRQPERFLPLDHIGRVDQDVSSMTSRGQWLTRP